MSSLSELLKMAIFPKEFLHIYMNLPKNPTTRKLTVLCEEICQHYPFRTFMWVTSERQTDAHSPCFPTLLPFTSQLVSSKLVNPFPPLRLPLLGAGCALCTCVLLHVCACLQGYPLFALALRPPQVSVLTGPSAWHCTALARLMCCGARAISGLSLCLFFLLALYLILSICPSLDYF